MIGTVAEAATTGTSPWRFLHALTTDSEADRQLLALTRASELQVLINLVTSSRVSVLYAYSGNGKSSLVNAGIIPELQKAGYVVFRTRPRPPFELENPERAFKMSMLRELWVPEFPPEDRKVPEDLRQVLSTASLPEGERLVALLDRLSGHWTRVATSEGLRSAFVQHMSGHLELPLHDFVARSQNFFGPNTQMLFVCDQFEELFVHYSNTPELRSFVSAMGTVFVDSSLRAQILFSMREDWVGSLVEFRQHIPEILANTFKLLPLRTSTARAVLGYPLQAEGIAIEPALVERILHDLAGFYRVLQYQRYGRVQFNLSPSEDPFIELPAVQVVAEKMWETRHKAKKMFSLEHYLSLPALMHPESARTGPENAREERSPARIVLEEYLPDMVGGLDESGPTGGRMERYDLRMDILFALSDERTHRKALDRHHLLADVNRVRPSAVCRSVEDANLDEVLPALISARLVRVEPGDGSVQYELAHDFLVRSVVREWEKLDRRRTEQAAIEKRNRVSEVDLRRSYSLALWAAMLSPLLIVAALWWSGLEVERQRDWERSLNAEIAQLRRLLQGSCEISTRELDWADELYRLSASLDTRRLRDGLRDVYRGRITDVDELGQLARDQFLRAREGSRAEDLAARLQNFFGTCGRHTAPAPDVSVSRESLWALPVLASLFCLLLGFIARVPSLRFVGLGAVAASVICWSASPKLNFDGEWGWRMAIAVLVAMGGAVSAGHCAVLIASGKTWARKLRVFSGDLLDTSVGCTLVAALFLNSRHLGLRALTTEVANRVEDSIWLTCIAWLLLTGLGRWRNTPICGNWFAAVRTSASSYGRFLLRQLVFLGLHIMGILVFADQMRSSSWPHNRYGDAGQLALLYFVCLISTAIPYVLGETSLPDRWFSIAYENESIDSPRYAIPPVSAKESPATAAAK